MSALTEAQKAATIVISLGSETAAQVYKFLSEEEIEKLTYEIAKIQKLGSEDVEAILSDFYSLCLTQKVVTEGGVNYARTVLEKAFGAQVAASLLERVTRSLKTKAFEFIRKADYKKPDDHHSERKPPDHCSGAFLRPLRSSLHRYCRTSQRRSH